jgi:hypothetical protein
VLRQIYKTFKVPPNLILILIWGSYYTDH